MTEPSSTDSLTATVADDGMITVAGDIDMAGGPILEGAILERERVLGERTGRQADIVIDLAEVFFIDSSGLRTLLGATRRAGARDARVTLRSIGPEVIRLLEITGTLDHFHIENPRA